MRSEKPFEKSVLRLDKSGSSLSDRLEAGVDSVCLRNTEEAEDCLQSSIEGVLMAMKPLLKHGMGW